MSLTALNYLNIVAYLLNTVVTYGIGYTNLPSTQDLSAKYQTIITPAGFAFSIWGIIFLAEAVFCVAQVFPAYRSSSLVVKGVGYSYVGVCVAQAIWSIAFEFEQIILSLIAMLTILFFLLRIVNQLYKVRIDNEEEEDSKRRDYWLTVFPFSIHAGWILVASLVNINLVFVRFKAPANVQLAIAITSIVLIYIGTAATLQSPYEPNYVIPTVFAWALVRSVCCPRSPASSCTNPCLFPLVWDLFRVEQSQATDWQHVPNRPNLLYSTRGGGVCRGCVGLCCHESPVCALVEERKPPQSRTIQSLEPLRDVLSVLPFRSCRSASKRKKKTVLAATWKKNEKRCLCTSETRKGYRADVRPQQDSRAKLWTICCCCCPCARWQNDICTTKTCTWRKIGLVRLFVVVPPQLGFMMARLGLYSEVTVRNFDL